MQYNPVLSLGRALKKIFCLKLSGILTFISQGAADTTRNIVGKIAVRKEIGSEPRILTKDKYESLHKFITICVWLKMQFYLFIFLILSLALKGFLHGT